MVITDEAIVLKIQKFQEKSHIVSCLTKSYGIIKGLSNNSSSAKIRPEYFPGNVVQITWRSRLISQLGNLSIETQNNIYAYVINNHLKLAILNSALTVSERILQEQEPQETIFEKLKTCILSFNSSNLKLIIQKYIDLELDILRKSGYGIDLTKCIVSKKTNDLKYVSPRSGCAVSADIGKAYHNKLLALPQFLLNNSVTISAEDILNALKLTNYFLNKHIFLAQNKSTPLARIRLGEKIEEYLKQIT